MRKKLFVRRIGVIVTSMILVVLAINIAVTGQEKIVLKQASWLWAAPTIAPVMRHLAEQFTKENPNIAIQEAAVSPDQFFDNLVVHLAAKKPADVVNLISYNIALFYEMGYLEPLDSYIDMTKWPAKERLNPVVESAVFDGKTYGTTFQVNNYAILYNMRLFEEAGLTTPNNMEEFFDVAVKLTRGDVFGYAIPTASNQLVYLFDTATHWAVWYGGHFAKDGVPTALDPGVMNGMAGLKRVFDSGAMAKNLSQRDKHTRVVEGKIAMCGAEPVFIMGRAKEERPDVYPDLMYGKAFWPSGKYYTLSLIWSVPNDSQNK